MQYSYILSMTTNDKLSALQRLTFILKRHNLQLKQMHVFENTHKEHCYLNLVLHSDATTIAKCVQQLHRVIELNNVEIQNQTILV